MRLPRQIALFVTLCASLLVALGGGQAAAAGEAATDQYWLGPYFAGMRLTYTSPFEDKTFAYGDCEFPPGEGGCSVPAQVLNSSSCERNPVGIDRLPYRVFLVRGGGLATEYERSGIDIGTGGHTVTLYTEFELMGAALRDFKLRSEPAPQPLAPPVYPMPVLRELKRVTVAKERFGGIGAIARAIDLPPGDVQVRLEIADLLPPDLLADVPPPTMSTATVERLRQLAFDTQFNLAKGARKRGISEAALRKKINRVRGLTGYCPPAAGS